MDLREAISRVVQKRDLAEDEIAVVFGRIMDGEATPAQIGGLLVALRMKGETPVEIAGAAKAMRSRATTIVCPDVEHAVDTCGPGGDGSGTVNVSTLAAIVVAACGVRVAKHGNRALSSRSGSADVLEALGVNVTASVAVVERCLAEVNLGFLFAPAFHAATKHAAAPRKELGTRTIFNLLGPLTNPAGVKNQVIGVFDGAWWEPVAAALGRLGARRAFVVHGAGGLDEVAVSGPTRVAEWTGERVVLREISPADFGLAEADAAGLAGGDAARNAQILLDVLGGKTGAVRNAAAMEAALAIVATGTDHDLRAATVRALAAIDSGAARRTLDGLAKISRS